MKGMMIAILMGVSGCGKTTVGQALAHRHGFTFVDADDHHPDANVAKMKRGEPLTDMDRRPWLDALNALLRRARERGEPTVLACSALRQAYRERVAQDLPRDALRWVFLQASEQTIQQRLHARRGHFMPAALMRSQFDTLEPPAAEAVVIDADQPTDVVVAAVEAEFGLR